VVELCRKHPFSDASYYKWKAKFGGMDVSDAKRLRSLEEENNKLKRLLADALLDDAALKYGFTKVVSPHARREAVAALKTERQFSEPRACGLMNISTSVLRLLARPDTSTQLHELIVSTRGTKATLWPSTYPILLGREGWCVNVKRLYRSTAMRD
jgi:hypothetical protein